MTRARRPLFVKYFVTMFAAVAVPLMLGAMSEAWFAYRDQWRYLNEVLQVEARSTADRMQTFIDGISDQLGWVVQSPWTASEDDRRRIDALRLLQQVPAIVSVNLIDQAGIERVFVSRMRLNRIGRGIDMSEDPAVIGARAGGVWYGPVQYRHDSEPCMRIAIAGKRPAAGIVIADINLKLIRDVIAAIRIGDTGHAFIIDDSGRLIAHPDISLVLRGNAASGDFEGLKAAVSAANGSAVVTIGDDGKPAVALAVRASNVGWTVIAQQPIFEAFESIRWALWRSLALIAISAVVACALAYWLAHRMSGPIKHLENGVERIGMGQFDHRIAIHSGDELEQLASRFNEMAEELGISQQKSERITRLKQFLAPQVAELIETTNQHLLDEQRDVVAIFGDLRGFTACSARADPDSIMALLREYYEAVGLVTTRHRATLIRFAGDGVMVLVNAPVACENPSQLGVQLAVDMQATVQALVANWRARGYAIGFGMGAAMGPATVGTVGYEGRLDYTAIGSVVNLASRLCDAADDGQILLDHVMARQVNDDFALTQLGKRTFKGFDDAVDIFAVAHSPVAMRDVAELQPATTKCRGISGPVAIPQRIPCLEQSGA